MPEIVCQGANYCRTHISETPCKPVKKTQITSSRQSRDKRKDDSQTCTITFRAHSALGVVKHVPESSERLWK